ncbi:epoxide hydrolase [Chitinophaga agrisoli]|uniref:Epoxide hydrolase n=1 Tax=Chitinophaga agrisoli TaxID=2607653 RepID=A0A5B2VKF7_9BACT|nr:epoxide hydrolase family protein [Chitinophaga agrisoli]KAA2239561.1 epoxide hydrolase [Chitinophaga agrisoli]
MIQPFRIHIADAVLDDLRARLGRTRWPDFIEAGGWQHGVSSAYMQDLIAHWAHDFDWREQEARMNAYPHFIAEIEGHTIHFMHIRAKGQQAIPLLITHGWPGSFLEMLDIIPLLTAENGLCFDLVIPSLPGFGFSKEVPQEGMNTARIGGLWAQLMEELGYEQYLVQGGDLGAEISTQLALQQPERVLGLHLNYIPFTYRPYLPPGASLTEAEQAALKKTAAFFKQAGAYAQVHITQPLTLAYGLSDSPAGLAAWMLQIFKNFSDPRKELSQLFERDALLANITLYWVTGTIHSSMRLYSAAQPLVLGKDQFVRVPVGVAHYPYPESFPASEYVSRGYNLQYWEEMPAGGHFAAMEQPGLFAADVRAFAEQVVP